MTVFEGALDVGTSAMPWKEQAVMSIREEFVLKALEPNTSLATLCREFVAWSADALERQFKDVGRGRGTQPRLWERCVRLRGPTGISQLFA